MKDNKITRLYKKLVIRAKGFPVMMVIYKPWKKENNVTVSSVVPFEDDEYLVTRFKEIAERVRDNYQKDLDKILKENQLQ